MRRISEHLYHAASHSDFWILSRVRLREWEKVIRECDGKSQRWRCRKRTAINSGSQVWIWWFRVCFKAGGLRITGNTFQSNKLPVERVHLVTLILLWKKVSLNEIFADNPFEVENLLVARGIAARLKLYVFTVQYQKQRVHEYSTYSGRITRGRLVLQRITATNCDIFTLQDMHLERMHNTVHFDRLYAHNCLILMSYFNCYEDNEFNKIINYSVRHNFL